MMQRRVSSTFDQRNDPHASRVFFHSRGNGFAIIWTADLPALLALGRRVRVVIDGVEPWYQQQRCHAKIFAEVLPFSIGNVLFTSFLYLEA